MSVPALDIRGLSVAWGTRPVLHGVDVAIAPGEILGLVGESGSGKSTLAFSVLRHLPGGSITGGSIAIGGTDVLALDTAGLLGLRRRAVAMVYQDPNAALNPTLRLGEQLLESVRLAGDADGRAMALLEQVGLPDPARIMRRFAHEVSGGEKQRVIIAMALAARPGLLLCDEATTALDATTAAGIVDLLLRLRAETGMAMLFISHDLGTVARIADRVVVLRAGIVEETGETATVLAAPVAAYTRKLLAATPDPLAPQPARQAVGETLLSVENMRVQHGARGWFGRGERVDAVDDVSFTLAEGETLGLVGESGCGKSSLARALVGLHPVGGRLRLHGQAPGRSWRRLAQLIFQHPDASLNPRHRIGEIIGRSLPGRRQDVGEWLERVGLPADYVTRFPMALSGGQKQRVAIARAFAANPKLVVCDEITSSLDVSVQAEILALLDRLQRENGTAMLFISHDLGVVRRIAHRMAVMYLGRIVEMRDMPDGKLDPPFHPYTEALMSAAPVATAGVVAREIRLRGVPPGPRAVPEGCRFHPRCPREMGALCHTPPPVRQATASHAIACHLPLEALRALPPIWRRVGSVEGEIPRDNIGQ